MDPTEAYQQWQDAVGLKGPVAVAGPARVDAMATAIEIARDLVLWLINGGFRPKWTDREELVFRLWCGLFLREL